MTSTTMLCRGLQPAKPRSSPALTNKARSCTPQSRFNGLRVRADYGNQTKPETSKPEQGSFGKIEAPVRGEKPDAFTQNVEDRDNSPLTKPEFNRDTEWFGTEVGFLDGMRFYGAIPEVNNCRLAMLGFFAAIIAEAATGKNVFQQVASRPFPIAAIFFLVTLGSAAPVLRGFPRRGNSVFSPDAEVINGRIAMLAFFSIVAITAYRGSYVDLLARWLPH